MLSINGDFWSRVQTSLPRYDVPLRRRTRQVLRSTIALSRPAVLPVPSGVGAFWWDGHSNFGDALTPWLLPHLGIIPVLTEPAKAEIVGVGSILEMLPETFSGIIWGSGSMYGNPIHLPGATLAAVRGPLSRDLLGLPESTSTALGDPGLLVERVMRRPRVRYQLGVVPHGIHEDHPEFRALLDRAPKSVTRVLTCQPVWHVLRRIASCEAILTSSLHGLIVADSFGIPAAWTMPADLFGGRFKFHDYEAVVTPGHTREIKIGTSITVIDVLRAATRPDADRVERSKDDLARAAALLPRRPLATLVRPRSRRE